MSSCKWYASEGRAHNRRVPGLIKVNRASHNHGTVGQHSHHLARSPISKSEATVDLAGVTPRDADATRSAELAATLSALHASRQAAFERYSVAAGRVASRAFLGLGIADIFALAYFALAAAFPAFPTLPTAITNPLWPVAGVGFIAYVILGALSLLNGITLKDIARVIDVRVAHWTHGRLRAMFGD